MSSTPIKSIIVKVNDLCRVCGENIRITGRGKLNIFHGEKSKKELLSQRFSKLLDDQIVEEDGKSDCVCNKCVRELQKYERAMCNAVELRNTYLKAQSSFRLNIQVREKRCHVSPSAGVKRVCNNTNPRDGNHYAPIQQKSAKKKLMSEFLDNNAMESEISTPQITTIDDSLVFSHDKTKVEVIVTHERDGRSNQFKTVMSDETDKKIVRQFALSNYNYAANSIWDKPALQKLLLEKMKKTIQTECSSLCSRKNPSVLRRICPSDIVEFKDRVFERELKERSPILYSVLKEASVSARSKNKKDEDDTQIDTSLPPVCLAASLLLRRRCSAMSAIAYRMSTMLWHGGVKKQVYTRGARLGFCMSHVSTLAMIEKLGEDFDTDVMHWKADVEETCKKVIITKAAYEIMKSGDIQSEHDLAISIKAKVGDGVYSENILSDIQADVKGKEGIGKSKEEIYSALLTKYRLHRSPGFQITGDNVDLEIKAKHMSSSKQNRSIHWFNLNAVLNRVHGNHLPNESPMKSILSIENVNFLPSHRDNQNLLHDLIPLYARSIVSKIPALSNVFGGAVVQHIPHIYTNEMNEKSEQVPLGLLFKNENKTDDMIEILSELHNKYVPAEQHKSITTVLDRCFFGGDQLTDERARNAVLARSDGDNMCEQLKGLIPKVEDWHCGRLIYQILYDILFKSKSVNDVGSMCSNMNVTCNVNAKTNNVLDNFNRCKDFVNMETDAFMVAAALQYFGIDSVDAPAAHFIPPHILDASLSDKRLWLHRHTKAILQKFVMNDFVEQNEHLRQGILTANVEREKERYTCRICDKVYVYQKARSNHESLKHGIATPDNDSTPTPSSDSEESTCQDSRYNYACTRMSFGLFIRNFDDAVKEGDGKRIVRCWKFLMLIFKAYGHPKYALAAFQMQASTLALLTSQEAHQLIWNRTVNNKGGKGKNISLDLKLEQINNFTKELLKNLGPNITEKAASRSSKAVYAVDETLQSLDESLSITKPKGHHKVKKREKDFKIIVNELHVKGRVFTCDPKPERQYQEFPNFSRNILNKLNYTKLNNWITEHKKTLNSRQFSEL